MTSCKTNQNQIDQEIEQYLEIEYTPDLIYFDSDNPELGKILIMQLDFYSKYLIVLLQAKETGAWIQPFLDEEIKICRNIIKWLQELSDKLKAIKLKKEG
jgi:hypothetical protein